MADWELHFTRFRCPLIEVAIQTGWSDFMFPVENIIVNSAEVYLNTKQYEGCVRSFQAMVVKNPTYLSDVPKNAYVQFETKKTEFLALEAANFTKLSDSELTETFKKWFDWLHEWMVTNLAPANLAEEIVTVSLQKELGRYVDPAKDFNKFQELQLLFAISARPGFLERYEEELRMLKGASSDSIEKKVSSLEHEYGWLGDTGRLDNFWNKDEIRKQALSQQDSSTISDNSSLVNKALDEINADDALKKSVTLAREYVHFRTFRIDVCLIFSYRARFLFEEVARRLAVSFKDFTYMSSDEVISALKGETLPNDLDERKKGFAVILRPGETKIVSADMAKELALQMKGSENTSVTELKGTTACIGQVRGVVKLVFTKTDIDKVNEGDVLVSSMTKPELVPAMKKAGAIVTDEGGITCHAAIVSRELKKPCVIGTKIATKVLKDGDMVEVDATKGVVRKV